MTDPHDASRDIEWYRSRWDTLCTVLDLDDPDAVVSRVRELQLDMMQSTPDTGVSDDRREVIDHLYERLQVLRDANAHLRSIQDLLEVDTPEDAEVSVEALRERVAHLRSEQEALDEADLSAEQAVRMISTMEAQLDVLYREKGFTEDAALQEEGDTFEQLQALLAREERLKRELGVSSIDQVIEMVEGMSEQLSVLYEDIEIPASDGEGSEAHTMPANGQEANGQEAYARGAHLSRTNGHAASDPLHRLQDALGVNTPDDIIAMVNSLTRQLEDLYAARERLTEANAADEETIVAMVNNMQHQLESLYESQERMSQKGVKDVDQALAMIDNMEQQLAMLYEERASATADEVEAMRHRLQEKTDELNALREEKQRLLRERDALRASVNPDAVNTDAVSTDADGSATGSLSSTGSPAETDPADASSSSPSRAPSRRSSRSSPSATRLQTMEQNFGTRDPERIAALIHSMDEQMGPQSTGALQEAASRLLSRVESLIDEDTLADLEDMSTKELDALDVGVFCLDDAGRINLANRAALAFPGCSVRTPEAVEGHNFFFDLAPSTNNALFRGRFIKGVRNGSLDVQFPYTFIRPGAAPTNLMIRLHRKPTEAVNWVLFERL